MFFSFLSLDPFWVFWKLPESPVEVPNFAIAVYLPPPPPPPQIYQIFCGFVSSRIAVSVINTKVVPLSSELGNSCYLEETPVVNFSSDVYTSEIRKAKWRRDSSQNPRSSLKEINIQCFRTLRVLDVNGDPHGKLRGWPSVSFTFWLYTFGCNYVMMMMMMQLWWVLLFYLCSIRLIQLRCWQQELSRLIMGNGATKEEQLYQAVQNGNHNAVKALRRDGAALEVSLI